MGSMALAVPSGGLGGGGGVRGGISALGMV